MSSILKSVSPHTHFDLARYCYPRGAKLVPASTSTLPAARVEQWKKEDDPCNPHSFTFVPTLLCGRWVDVGWRKGGGEEREERREQRDQSRERLFLAGITEKAFGNGPVDTAKSVRLKLTESSMEPEVEWLERTKEVKSARPREILWEIVRVLLFRMSNIRQIFITD